MKFLEHVQQLHKLIDEENTGSPKILAGKMRMSVSNVHNIISFLKSKGAKIKYSNKRKSYYYVEPFVVNISVDIRPLSNKEMLLIIGGCSVSDGWLLLQNGGNLLFRETAVAALKNFQIVL